MIIVIMVKFKFKYNINQFVNKQSHNEQTILKRVMGVYNPFDLH